jgi:antitoxin HigA-1
LSIKNDGPAGWAVHPGEILREEFLRPMGISPYRLSVDLGVSAPTVNEIVREKRAITPEVAVRLARYFGTSEQFWLNLQDAFAVYHVRKKYSRKINAIKPGCRGCRAIGYCCDLARSGGAGRPAKKLPPPPKPKEGLDGAPGIRSR